MGSNLVIVAIPDENDRVWQVSSEKVPHLTLLFLGDSAQVANADQIVQFVEHAADTMLKRFYLSVDRRDTLGADNADVLFFRKGYDTKAVREFRNALLKDTSIRTAYDSAPQFEGPWQPHLTLGYPATPAKKPGQNEHDKFYDVSFNKIAVWIDDYAGPEFLLKDYWDEGDDEIDEPAIAMSTIDQERVKAGMAALEHHGIKGMKWGHRKTPSVVARPKNALTTKQQVAVATLGVGALLNRNVRTGIDTNQKNMANFRLDKSWEKDFQKAKGFSFNDQKFTSDYNAKWKNHDFSKEDWNNPSPTYKKYTDGYFKELNTSYAKQFADHFGSSPSGKYEAHHEPGTDLVKLRLKDTAQHAAEVGVLVTFRITRDDNGLITGLDSVDDASTENTLAQTAMYGEAFVEGLMHFGVKGMHWGITRAHVHTARVARLRKEGDALNAAADKARGATRAKVLRANAARRHAEADALQKNLEKNAAKRAAKNAPPVAVTPSASSKVPHGAKRKTKIDVQGGENHPAHVDAIKVAQARVKLSKSGPAALSNQELRDVANRIQLESQVSVLTSHKGKRFVTRQLQNEGQNLARQGVKKGLKKGALKVGAAALI